MRLAYLSPLPPVASGVSEYSADLLPHLAALCDVRAFGDGAAAGTVAGMAIERAPEFDRAQRAGEFDLAVYQMGNNQHHRFVHERARREPGLLVLHDLVLHHFYVEELLAKGDAGSYLALLEESYGEAGRAAGLANQHEVTSPLTLFALPLCETLIARSRGLIVHSRRAAAYARAHVAGVPVEVVPMGIPEPERDPLPQREEARAALGLAPDAFVAGVFGFLTPIKRADVVLRAFAGLARRRPDARLVLIGEASPAAGLARLAREMELGERVVLTGFLPYAEVKRWVAAADVFVNLRYPTAGETSASLLRLLGWGKAVVVSDYAQFREIPEAVALRVAIGPAEQDELEELLALLAARPELRRGFETRAAAHVRRHHRLEDAARAYVDFARHAVARPVRPGRLIGRPRPPTSRRPRHPRVRIEGSPLPERVAPGERLSVAIRLVNVGDTVLLAGDRSRPGTTEIAGYLRDAPGGPRLLEPATQLPRDLAPGEKLEIEWTFTVPDVRGQVSLVAGPRISGWGWLHARGSEALVYRLEVGR